MAYYAEADLPSSTRWRAFTPCYHCSFTGGTNVNRLFLWTGTNDGAGRGHGPAMGTHNKLIGGDPAGAHLTTYPERLERAGIRWRIYQDMADNYALNPTAGFKAYRDAYQACPARWLREKALSTRGWTGCARTRWTARCRRYRGSAPPRPARDASQPVQPGPGRRLCGACWTR